MTWHFTPNWEEHDSISRKCSFCFVSLNFSAPQSPQKMKRELWKEKIKHTPLYIWFLGNVFAFLSKPPFVSLKTFCHFCLPPFHKKIAFFNIWEILMKKSCDFYLSWKERLRREEAELLSIIHSCLLVTVISPVDPKRVWLFKKGNLSVKLLRGIFLPFLFFCSPCLMINNNKRQRRKL